MEVILLHAQWIQWISGARKGKNSKGRPYQKEAQNFLYAHEVGVWPKALINNNVKLT